MISLHYLTPSEFALQTVAADGRTLGVIAFGNQPEHSTVQDYPYAWANMPVLGGDTLFECWRCEQPVIREHLNGIHTARNDDVLFGCLAIDAYNDIAAVAHSAYIRIFDAIESRGYRELLRVWHYFPRINESENGLERYRHFNIGRYNAFVAKRRDLNTGAPAACAIGTRSGPLTIYFLAGRNPGQAIDNPRQASACNYPPQYGPRAPLFSRAMLVRQPGSRKAESPLLFISGTASVIGHETVHTGSAARQAAETATNLAIVITEAQRAGFTPHQPAGLQLKVYVRNPHDQPAVSAALAPAFGAAARIVYLHADICRADLLTEVEALCTAEC